MHYIIAFSFNNTIIIVLILVLCLKTLKSYYILSSSVQVSTVNSRFKKDLNLQIHLQNSMTDVFYWSFKKMSFAGEIAS